MEPFLIVVGLFVAYQFLIKRSAGIASAPVTNTPPAVQPGVTLPGYTLVQGGGGPSIAETSTLSGVAAGLNFVPVVGPILGAAFGILAGGLMQASAKRAAAARNENQAVAAAVPGWDAGMAQVVSAYNQGKINLDEVFQLIMVPQINDSSIPSGQGIMWKNYWKECGPQIQSGRNGCQTGTATQPANQSWCGGSYGASCCVAYDNLKNSAVYAMRAAKQADENPGTAVTSQVFPTVFASKYGGINRPGYSVTFKRPKAPATIGL